MVWWHPAGRQVPAAVPTDNATPLQPARLSYSVTAQYPHDRGAYTQGLLLDEHGTLYESTGMYGHSSLRRDVLQTGRIQTSRSLPGTIFGEGLALVDGRLIQITWQSGRALVWDRDSFAPLGEFAYQGEGWGLTYDGKALIMSDGSDKLTFRDPQSFAVQRVLAVTMGGKPLPKLNELEWVQGLIAANVWMSDWIVFIKPDTGEVAGYLDMQGVLPQSVRNGHEEVLNGIAWMPASGHLLVTGKYWPRLFEIKVPDLATLTTAEPPKP